MKAYKRGLLGEQRLKKHAVLVPLVETPQGHTAVLFTKRAAVLRRQAGEICFPGGHWETSDETEWHTALRETTEELQVPPESIRYLGDLDILVAPSQMIVYPFVGQLAMPERIHPNPDEVEEYFCIELERLLAIDPDCYETLVKVEPLPDFPFHLIPNGREYAWRIGTLPQYFYEIDGRVIWGLTARILNHFLDVVRG
ncbi:CoA pyrophosphatase [Brevibacillus sp. SYP-B805]|nr:CoA pyrophosphatase [Brevibacillus sp. SYP-B805]